VTKFRLMMVVGSMALTAGAGCGRPMTKVDAGCVAITCPATGGSSGSAGGGSAATGGGGGGGGTATGGGRDAGMAPTTIQAAKAATFPAKVNLKSVVVTAVSFARASAATSFCSGISSADGGMTKGVNASFWIADQNGAQHGVWLNKFRCDGEGGDADYFPTVGDVLNVSGVIGFNSAFTQREGYRITVKSEFDFIPNKPANFVCSLSSAPPCQPLSITKVGAMAALPANEVPSTFGGNGAIKAEPTYSGARVHIAGPLSFGMTSPEAMHRITAAGANDSVYFGFSLSNGVLVNNFRTFEGAVLDDGGVAHCDLRNAVIDGGTVTFPNGIAGVWDTYTMASCADGGTNFTSCFNNRGTVPGTPDANYTNVLYPTDCADYLQ
jgi:hypothetical protein